MRELTFATAAAASGPGSGPGPLPSIISRLLNLLSRVWGFVFRISELLGRERPLFWDFGIRVQGSGLRVWGFGSDFFFLKNYFVPGRDM